MAEESDLEKTEPATPRRLEKAKEEGDVPRSKELGTCTILLAAGMGLWVLGDGLMQSIQNVLSDCFVFERARAFDMNILMARIAANIEDLALAFFPMAILLIIVALASPLLIGGWLFSTKSLMPNFGKLNPIKGISNLFSTRSLMELFKAVGKAVLIGVVAWLVVSSKLSSMMMLSVEPLNIGAAHMADTMLLIFMTLVGALVLIAGIDAPYQMWQHATKLKMTRQEIRDEHKESEGNPEIKAKIRMQQREIARRRMMAEVPTADVVVTNPTHYAVALKYEDGKMKAPKVVAKGVDVLAAKIREVATENEVPLLEAPALARVLYRHAELDDEIPEMLYVAVAEVLAYVFQLRAYHQYGGMAPDAPEEIYVPPHLDPHNMIPDETQADSRMTT